jgi:hypothetical protein
MHAQLCLIFSCIFCTNFSVAGVASLLLHSPQLLFSSSNVAGDPAFSGVLAAVYVRDVPVVSEAAVVRAFSHFHHCCIESLLLLLLYSGCFFFPAAAGHLFSHCKENLIYLFLFWELHGLSHNFHIHVSMSDLYIPRISPHTSLQQRGQTDPGNINLSKIFECRNWETEHYNSVLEITVSFLGIHKWEPDIYIGFSPALHLQWLLLSQLLLMWLMA